MPSLRDAPARLRASLLASIGDVTFGMEDGAVSIAGLVFGVAASTNDAQIVVLAGATGAVAGAVSMMAGTYLDVHSERSVASARVADAREALTADPEEALNRVAGQVREAGFTPEETDAVVAGLRRNPEALVSYVAAFELGVPMRTESSPRAHALWMFAADLFAAGVPVVPFILFPIDTARIVSLIVTGLLMAALGVARGRIGRESVTAPRCRRWGSRGPPHSPAC